jgi:putative glutamine amidotransferase
MKTTPVIGMPARMDPGKDNQYLSRHYADAISLAGGAPVIIPLLEDPEVLRPMLESLDGVLLTGSNSDVDPLLYGADRLPECGPVQKLRDRTDFLLLDFAHDRGKPILAICFGLQSLNVYRGGSLVKDIPSHIETTIKHSQPSPDGSPVHSVQLSVGSPLAKLAGASNAMVNSTHHQALDRLGRDLEIVAIAPDGIVEGVIGTKDEPLVLGVQWHPEKNYRDDKFSREIFHHFLARCGAI